MLGSISLISSRLCYRLSSLHICFDFIPLEDLVLVLVQAVIMIAPSSIVCFVYSIFLGYSNFLALRVDMLGGFLLGVFVKLIAVRAPRAK